ncbi:MAG: hypothetical protein Kow006_08230 [Gammaproteobacteria bacterium]
MAPQEPFVEQRPISLRLARRSVQSGRWSADQWRILGVATSLSEGGLEATLLDQVATEEGEEFLWDRLPLTLYPDETAFYQFNLLAETPVLFVVCTPDEETGLMSPTLLSLSQDEAASAMEVDDEVLSVPLPGDIRRWAESYIARVGLPEPKKKRKRA